MQLEQSFSARLLYPVNGRQPFLKIDKDISNCMVGIPSISVTENTISYGPFAFHDSEFGQSVVVKLAIASTSLLSAKSIFYWFYQDQFNEWLASKTDLLRASYVMNIILDILARQRILEVEGKNFYNNVIRIADMLAISLLPHHPKNFSLMAQATLASFVLDIPCYAPAPILKIAHNFLAELNTLSFDGSKVIEVIRYNILSDTNNNISSSLASSILNNTRSGWQELGELGDNLDAIAATIPGRWYDVYLPYSHALAGSTSKTKSLSIFQSKLVTEEDFANVKQGQFHSFANQADRRLEEVTNEAVGQEIFFDLVREEKRREKIREKLSRATKKLNFSNVGFPLGDYIGYYRVYSDLLPHIRKMIEQARLIKNILDESTFEEMGNIDLQVAIQSIASETIRNDMFIKDENLLKSESWTILVDSSLSLRGSSNLVKALLICLAETAREIVGSGPWAMFAFSDEFYCIKDFTEPYDNLVKARIGGLTQNGLSYIPDAIRACRSLILEHAKERNYLILVSDGNPSGYSNIEDEFSVSIKELGKFGIDLAAVGIISNRIKKTIRKARIINEPSDIVKQFMEIYFGLSS